MSTSLRSLSDHELLTRTHALVARERKITLEVLLHLIEIERRKLHLKQGYSTMFEYCTACLGYSASAAMRRIQAARCIAEFPEVHGLLDSNDVNLSTICIVAKHLTPDNKANLLPRICGKSQREVELIVAELEPLTAMPRDRVRTVVVRVPVKSNYRSGNQTAVQAGYPGAPVATDINEHYRSGNNTLFAARPSSDDRCRSGNKEETVKLEPRSVVQFSASPAFMSKVARIRALAAHRLPANASLEQIFELAMDCFIEKEDPARRQERREARNTAPKTGSAITNSPRAIPASVRDHVILRDQQRCSYVSPDGKRCESTHALQIDHIQPVARGGSASVNNLRLLCAKHNRLEAERVIGRSGPPRPSR